MPSISISTKFNEEVETDLMFYKKHIGFHIIDRAIRLSDGCEVSDKKEPTLLDAYSTVWFQRHGGAKFLYTDGESGLTNETAIERLKSLGTTLRVRAPGQHARIAESRQSMLRHVMHLTEAELKRHNETIPFKRLYGEALFVANAFTFYNGVSPYNAHTGRQPACLPDLEDLDFKKEGEQSDGLREQRIRQASIEAITQSTAVAKVNRALNASTTTDGGRLYKVGDLVDYHRPTATKDEHGGWNGPYAVIKNELDRGKLTVSTGSHEVIVRYPDARLTLFIECYIAATIGSENDAMDLIIYYIGQFQSGKAPEMFGYATTGSPPKYRKTTASKKAPKVLSLIHI